MKTKKITRKIKTFSKLVLPIAILATAAPVISMQVSSSNSHSKEIIFANKSFLKNDDIIKFLLDNRSLSVQDQKVMGDLGANYSNYDAGLLNKKNLPDYNVDKINLAYLTATGSQTQSYEDAVKTY